MRLRTVMDAGLVALMLAAFAYQLTGNLVHEIIGMAMCALLLAHNLVNRRWYELLSKGRYSWRRILNLTVTALLIADVVALVVSGIMISSDLFGFLKLNGGLGARQVHTACAYWLLVMASFHLGMHWDSVFGVFRRRLGINSDSRIRRSALWLVAIVIAAYGMKSAFDMDIHYKLVSHHTFDFWDFENESAGFFAAYLSIMGLMAFIAYSGTKLIRRARRN